jgi:hypothetical protein
MQPVKRVRWGKGDVVQMCIWLSSFVLLVVTQRSIIFFGKSQIDVAVYK